MVLGIRASGDGKRARRYWALGQLEIGKEQEDIGHKGKWRLEKSKKILGIRASGDWKKAKRYWVSGESE